MAGKTAEQSRVILSQIVMPGKTNSFGNLMGGNMMYMMDMAAGMTAAKHSGRPSVTVRVSDITFKTPVPMGNFVTITSEVIGVGRTSMTIMVIAEGEDYKSGRKYTAVTAVFKFVALDENGKPTPVPPLI